MRRRKFVAFVGAAHLLTHEAQAQGTIPVVGFLNPVSPDTYAFNAVAFREGLAQAGFVEGRNVRIEYRWARGDYSLLPALAAELAALKVAAIAATGDIASARAAKSATSTIPIVFTIGADPVGHGLVASLNRPGGNVTGVNLFSSILSGKRVELLTKIAPNVRRIAMIMNPDNFTAAAEEQDGFAGARALHRETFVVKARKPDEIASALTEPAAQSRCLPHRQRPVDLGPPRRDRRIRAGARPSRHRVRASVRRRWCAAQLRPQYHLDVPASGSLHRRDPERRQAGGAPGDAADGLRVRCEPQNSAALGLEPRADVLLSANEVIK